VIAGDSHFEAQRRAQNFGRGAVGEVFARAIIQFLGE